MPRTLADLVLSFRYNGEPEGITFCPRILNHNSQSSTDLATSYAALILADDGIEITVSKPMNALMNAKAHVVM